MEMNKMDALVFFCVVFGSMTSQTPMATTETTSCTAPSVRKGEPVIITCDYGRNISKLIPVTFNLEQYPSNENNKEVSVVDCNWIDTDQPICQPSTGYTFDGWTLRFVIENASERHTGRYACKVMSQKDKPDPSVCTFQLAAVPVDGSTTSGPDDGNTTGPVIYPNKGSFLGIIVGAVVSLIVVAVIVGVLVFCYIRKRTNGRRPQPDANESRVPMLSRNVSGLSRASEPNAGEKADTDALANSPQPKDADDINSKPADSESSQPEKQHHPEDEEERTEGISEQDRPVEQENAIEDDESGDESKTLLAPVDGSVDSPHRQQEEKDDTIPEDTVRTPETVTEKVGPSEDAETEQEEGVVKTKGPGVEEVIKKLEEKKD